MINKRALPADYMNANARQLQAVYDYQRTVLNAFTEVFNSLAKVENYCRSYPKMWLCRPLLLMN